MRICVVSLLLVAVLPGAVLGAGLNLSWDGCGALGTENKMVPCDSLDGTVTLYGSFVAPPGITGLYGASFVVDIGAPRGMTLPPWWDLAPGGCRSGTLSVSYSTGGGCRTAWSSPLGRFEFTRVDSDRIRLEGSVEIYNETAVDVPEGEERTLFAIQLRLPEGIACDGCERGVCMLLESAVLFTSTGHVPLDAAARRNWVTWQQAFVSTCGCASRTDRILCPVEHISWGQLKSTYR